jgi:hypothetical protein
LEADGLELRRLREAAWRTLAMNWREGERDGRRYAYTCPAPPRYVHQWYWDSCFHAIVWSRFDPFRAREELRTLLRASRGDGFVPGTVFWSRPPGWRRAPLYATAGMFGSWMIETTNTPLLAFAWERVAEASADEEPGFRTEALDRLCAHYDWLDRERDPDRDGLISIAFPDESGLDDSPKYDPVFRRLAHYRPGYFWLVERSRRLGYRFGEIARRYREHVEDVLVNVAYALSLRALSRLLGESPEGAYALRARRTERALLDRCWDAEHGLFLDLAGPDERPVQVSTWSSLAPLALDGIPVDVRRRLVEEHLLEPRRYLAPVGIPSVSMEEPSFTPRFDFWRCWRGPSWVNTAWLLVPPMRELGYEEEARRIVTSLVAAADRHGFREYYNPLDGRGLGARDFGWSTLLLELADPPDSRPRNALMTAA